MRMLFHSRGGRSVDRALAAALPDEERSYVHNDSMAVFRKDSVCLHTGRSVDTAVAAAR